MFFFLTACITFACKKLGFVAIVKSVCSFASVIVNTDGKILYHAASCLGKKAASLSCARLLSKAVSLHGKSGRFSGVT